VNPPVINQLELFRKPSPRPFVPFYSPCLSKRFCRWLIACSRDVPRI
jgi:hypothetical protein